MGGASAEQVCTNKTEAPHAVGMINQKHHIKLGHCAGCNRAFLFSPAAINDRGTDWELNQPICQDCIDKIFRRLVGEKLPFIGGPLIGVYDEEQDN